MAAETDATRSRRKRLHAAGDHSACREPSRCRGTRRGLEPLPEPLDETDPDLQGGIADMVLRFAEACQWEDDDPRKPMGELAWTLAVLCDADPRAVAVARLLAELLKFLADHPGRPAELLDEVHAIRYARRAQSLLHLAP